MHNVDKELVNIDIDDPELQLDVDIAIREECDAHWEWNHRPLNWEDRPSSILVWLVHGGEADLRTSRGDLIVRQGDFLLMPSRGVEYLGRHTEEPRFDVTWLFFRTRHGLGVLDGVAGIPFHTELADLPFVELLMGRLRTALPAMRGTWLRAVLDEVRRQCAQQGHSTSGKRMRELGERIHAAPGRYHGLDDMLRDYPYSKDHLIRLFREHHGITPVEFLIRARMATAHNLLMASDFSIKQIAAQLGYADSFCFSRQFKAREGVSPSAFRKRHVAMRARG